MSDMDNKKITLLETKLAKDEAELRLYLSRIPMIAKIHRAKYIALIGEGFSKEEALELCKKIV